MKCDCEGWSENVHNPHGGHDLTFDKGPWAFCPWCGNRLGDDPLRVFIAIPGEGEKG